MLVTSNITLERQNRRLSAILREQSGALGGMGDAAKRWEEIAKKARAGWDRALDEAHASNELCRKAVDEVDALRARLAPYIRAELDAHAAPKT